MSVVELAADMFSLCVQERSQTLTGQPGDHAHWVKRVSSLYNIKPPPLVITHVQVCHQYPFVSLVLLGTGNFLKDPALSLCLGDLIVLTMCPTGSHMNNWIPLSTCPQSFRDRMS